MPDLSYSYCVDLDIANNGRLQFEHIVFSRQIMNPFYRNSVIQLDLISSHRMSNVTGDKSPRKKRWHL